MVKIVKDVKVPMDEVVSYLIEKGYLNDEFELGNIEQVEVKKEQIVKHSEIGGSLNSLNFRVNADLNLNNYIKKNEIDKYIDSQNKEETSYKKVDSEKHNSEPKISIKSFYEVLLDTIKEQELRKGGR